VRASILKVFLAAIVFAFSSTAFCADMAAPSLKEASLVTEVLAWGETITAVRLEYSDEIYCGEVISLIPPLGSDPSLTKYHVYADRSITNVYVNSSGKKDDVEVYGKYVFINLGISDMDPNTYRSQITFNPTTRTRPRLAAYLVSQIFPITTRSGKVIAPITVSTTREISIGPDDYTTFTYKNETTGHTLYYHLYIPKGYESKSSTLKNLPLVVHYPAGDYTYVDWTGKYRGALFTHHDALYWSDEESQARHPAFVVTVGGPADPSWGVGGTGFAESEMQQNYVKVIQKILTDYNVDGSRIYAVSLAGGSVPMWNTILANPTIFAAQISTSYDPYHAFKDLKSGEDKFATLLKTMPGWYFASLYDPTGAGVLGPADTRFKGERLRDISELMNKNGFNIEIGYGTDGELMWNGLLRGDKANKLADDQLARARAKSSTHLVTIFMPGTIPINQHWSWDSAYSNAEVRNWLFQQVNKAPYAPGK
jgi:predicted peptidase